MVNKKKLVKKAAPAKKAPKSEVRAKTVAPKAKAPVAAPKKVSKAAAPSVSVKPAKVVKVAKAVKPAAAKAPAAPAQPAPVPHKNWPEAERRRFRATLVATRERLTRQVSVLKGESLQRTEEIITSEDGTDAFDRQFALSVASNEQNAVYEIDEAIRRLDTGTYGICGECGCEIERLRLKALPFVRLCVKCQSAQEKHRPPFRVWTEG